MKYLLLMIILLLVSCGDNAYADQVSVDPALVETRFCGEPKRNSKGEIYRSTKVRLAFEAMYPLPPGEKRADYAVNHTIPLASGGCDYVSNMDWLRIIGKSCGEPYCKDRYERLVYPELRYKKTAQ